MASAGVTRTSHRFVPICADLSTLFPNLLVWKSEHRQQREEAAPHCQLGAQSKLTNMSINWLSAISKQKFVNFILLLPGL